MTTCRIDLVCAPHPRHWVEESIEVPTGSTVAEALTLSGWRTRFALDDGHDVVFGIWGRAAGLGAVLRDGDRLEVLRPLKVDPKVARRERFQSQGARSTGLFSQRRPGAKAGY